MGHIAALTLSHITTHSITAAVLYQCGGGMVSGHGPVGRVRCRVPALQRVSSGVVRLGHDWVASARARTQCAGLGHAIARLHVHMATGHRAPGTPTSLNMADNPNSSEEVPLMRHNVSGSRNYAWFCQLSLFRLQSNKNTRG